MVYSRLQRLFFHGDFSPSSEVKGVTGERLPVVFPLLLLLSEAGRGEVENVKCECLVTGDRLPVVFPLLLSGGGESEDGKC